eukprot:3544416-Pleurochrysis_carterae.AAC.3
MHLVEAHEHTACLHADTYLLEKIGHCAPQAIEMDQWNSIKPSDATMACSKLKMPSIQRESLPAAALCWQAQNKSHNSRIGGGSNGRMARACDKRTQMSKQTCGHGTQSRHV